MSVLSTANEEDVYFNFINSLKSDVTKKTYEREIKKFMNFCGVEKLSDLLTVVLLKLRTIRSIHKNLL